MPPSKPIKFKAKTVKVVEIFHPRVLEVVFQFGQLQDDNCKLSSMGLVSCHSYLCSGEHPHEELCEDRCHILNRTRKKGAQPKCALSVFVQHFAVCSRT